MDFVRRQREAHAAAQRRALELHRLHAEISVSARFGLAFAARGRCPLDGHRDESRAETRRRRYRVSTSVLYGASQITLHSALSKVEIVLEGLDVCDALP